MEQNNSYKEVVVTLFEGHYEAGVAALINSLNNSGFKGLISVGYKGGLPHWTSQLKRLTDNEFYLSSTITIKFEEIATELHFGYYKPFFVKENFERYGASAVFYFDPDIVVNAPWHFFTNWKECGICLCLDNCFPFVSMNHPWRSTWSNLAGDHIIRSNIDWYVNSGFIGVSKGESILLERWIDLTNRYKSIGGDLKRFEKEGHRAFKGDQDLLNAALTISTDIRLSVVGKEGMGFSQPAYLMTHAVGDIKPWKRNFLLNVLKKGKKPDFSEKNFFKYCSHPIAIFQKKNFFLKKLDLKVAALLGRLLT